MVIPAWTRLVLVSYGYPIVLSAALVSIPAHTGRTGAHVPTLCVHTIIIYSIDRCVSARTRRLDNLKH